MSDKLSAERMKSIRAVLFDKDGTLIDFDRTGFQSRGNWRSVQQKARSCELARCSMREVMTG